MLKIILDRVDLRHFYLRLLDNLIDISRRWVFGNFICHDKRANKAKRVQTKRRESNFNPR